MSDAVFTRPGLRVTATDGDPAVVTAVGEVDVATVDALRDGLRHAAGNPISHDVDADLAQLDFIDASGTRALAHAAHELHDTGHRLTVHAASPIARRVLHLVNLAHLIDCPH